MTRTTPLRLTILQLRHIFFTDARTFILLILLKSTKLLFLNTYFYLSFIAIKIGFFHDTVILVRHHMRLYLRHEIHHHNNDNQ